MKRLFLYLFLILFTLQTPSQADDIRDFQIEGMSIGDSALDYFTKNQIINADFKMFKDDKYSTFVFYDSDYEVYEAVEIAYKKNDKKFIISSISGGITVTDKKVCLKKKDEIVESLKSFFPESQNISDEGAHPVDTTGESKYHRTSFKINPKAKYFEVEVSCLFFTGQTANEYSSNAGITIKTDTFNDWVTYEAYK